MPQPFLCTQNTPHRSTVLSSQACPNCLGHWHCWTSVSQTSFFSFLECSIQKPGGIRARGGTDYVSNKTKCSCSQTRLQLPFVIFLEPQCKLSLLGARDCQLRRVQGEQYTGYTAEIQESQVWEAPIRHLHHALKTSWASFNLITLRNQNNKCWEGRSKEKTVTNQIH